MEVNATPDSLNDSADVFANSSAETVTENLNYTAFLKEASKAFGFSSSENLNILQGRLCKPVFTSSPLPVGSPVANISANISIIANQFVSEACSMAIHLYCPFCPAEFPYEFTLKDHIKNIHPQELKSIVRSKDCDIKFHLCPFCHAKFYVKELLPKHVLHKHQESVITLSTGIDLTIYAQCRFCPHKVLHKHVKRLMVHIEKKHYKEFLALIQNQTSNLLMNPEDLKYFDADISEASFTTGLNKDMNKLSTKDSSQAVKKKSILKPVSKYSGAKNFVNLNKLQENDTSLSGTFQEIKIRGSARRKLRFDLPNSPEDDHNKENILNQFRKQKTRKSRWRLFFGKRRMDKVNKTQATGRRMDSPLKGSDDNSTPIFSTVGFKGEGVEQLAVLQFKCGLCFEGFDNNAHLLDHLRRLHRGLNLQPQYRCGECHAKFYRNSFLVRHCWYHHTPLCLKAEAAANENQEI